VISIRQGILCAGNLVFDTLVRPVDELPFGKSVWVDSIVQHLGGNGANTSYTLAKLGVPVRLMGVTGNDGLGDRVIAILRDAGVDLSLVERVDAATPATVAVVRSDGARALLHSLGASRLAFSDPPRLQPDGVSHFHLANLFALPNLRRHAQRMLSEARAAGLSTSLDTGWDVQGEWMAALSPCLDSVDLLFTNLDEARELTRTGDPRSAAQSLRNSGAREVVLKLGERGCAVFSEDKEMWVQAFSVNVVDTTGAGDCFAGGFLAGLYHGLNYADAARLANAVAALSVSELGAVRGIRSFEETREWMLERVAL
jgi:sugar/nucleoside kinase (ribokinase family)